MIIEKGLGLCSKIKNKKEKKKMRKLKKVAAVLLTAAMTLSASVMAFADTTVTFHFQNGKNWEEVGGYIFQGIGWTTNVTDNSVVTVNKADGTVKKLWPGARCTEEKEGWYTCTATFTDTVTTDGMIFKFNNLVGDAEVNTTTEQDDVDAMLASGLKTTLTATKDETEGILINKKNAILAGGTCPTDIYIEYDGKIATATAEAPESYKNAAALGGSTTTDNNASTTTDNNAGTTTNNNAGTTSTGTATSTNTSTGTSSSTKAPTTGDADSLAVVALGLASAVAVVAAKKKANA
ncbi:MAG: hypothetical protein IJA27_02070 [Lachnospiraceae bacterium]|nr:hypothetical protein [Lachnospiraceae bacterium]